MTQRAASARQAQGLLLWGGGGCGCHPGKPSPLAWPGALGPARPACGTCRTCRTCSVVPRSRLTRGALPVGAPALPAPLQVLLRRFPKSHPFAHLAGTENIIAFTTLRYRCVRYRGATALLPPYHTCTSNCCCPSHCCRWPAARCRLAPHRTCLSIHLLWHSLPSPSHPPCRSNPPLIVRGPGAGPAVTAAGVFGDLVTLARYLGAPS